MNAYEKFCSDFRIIKSQEVEQRIIEAAEVIQLARALKKQDERRARVAQFRANRLIQRRR